MKEFFQKIYNREFLYSLAHAAPALTLAWVDVSKIVVLPACLLWLSTFIYFGRLGRYAECMIAFIVLWLYIWAEIVTYSSIPTSVYIAYTTCALAFAFGLAGARQLVCGVYTRWGVGAAGGLVAFAVSFPALMCLCYFIIFQTVIPADAFYAIGQTHISEAWQFFHENIGIKWIVFVFLFTGMMIFVLGYKRKKTAGRIPFSLIASVLLLCLLNIASTRENLHLVTNIGLYAKQYAEEMEAFKEVQAEKEVFADIQAVKDAKGETAVLVIGESHNKRHMGLYGYHRNTTPKLDALYKAGELLRFDQGYSSHTHTMQTLSLALTQADLTNGKRYFESPTIIDIARAAGYETHWISNQALFGPWDNLVSIIAGSADHLIPLNRNVGSKTKTHNYDGAAIAELEKILVQKSDKNRLIIIHLMGSHGYYFERYPDDYAHFEGRLAAGEFGTELAKDKKAAERINQYDNSILYNDHVVSGLIETLEQSSGARFLLYFADHGEDAVEGVNHNSSQFTYDMTYIPMLLWASDNYKNRYGERLRTMSANAKNMFGNEHVYDTLVGLMDIRTKFFDAGKDLSSGNYKAHKKPSYILYREKEYASPGNVLYWTQYVFSQMAKDDQAGRIIPHRVNSLGKMADVFAAGFRSFELDLVFNADQGHFEVGHDSEAMSGKTLEYFLKKAPNGGFDKVWLDVKNLDDDNLEDALAELKRLDAAYGLKKYAIVESSMTGAAFAKIADAGFLSSYYLPTELEAMIAANDHAALSDAALGIVKQVSAQRVKAVSFGIEVYPFVTKYLQDALPKDVVYHTWDTKMTMASENFPKDMKAMPYYSDKRLKTILVSFPSDYSL